MRVAFLGSGIWGEAALDGLRDSGQTCAGAWAWTGRPPRGPRQRTVGLLKGLFGSRLFRHPDALAMERAAAAAGADLRYAREASAGFLKEEIRAASPDLVLVASWPHRIPDEILSLTPLGGINVHPSLLPKYPGPHPLGRMMAEGDTAGGVTLHRMTQAYDEGPILWQVPASLAGALTARDALALLAPLARRGVAETLRTLRVA